MLSLYRNAYQIFLIKKPWFWGGNDVGLLPGCKTTMERLVAKGKIIGILSNSTQLAKTEIEKLKNHGLIQGKHFHFFVTSGTVAKQIFLNEEIMMKKLISYCFQLLIIEKVLEMCVR